jgi:hypothetical protein
LVEGQCVFSCSCCLTDYDMVVLRRGSNLQVKIVTYHRLGRCRSPEEWEWESFGRRTSRPLPARSQAPYRAGDIRTLWNFGAVTGRLFLNAILFQRLQ